MPAGPVFPTLSYRAQLLRSGQTTAPFRHAASQLYFVLEGEGYTEVNGERLAWTKNDFVIVPGHDRRSEEPPSELQSLMRSSYAVFCLKKERTTVCIHVQNAH